MEIGEVADCGDVSEIFLNQPGSLKRLLGETSEVLPKEGVNIRMVFKETEANRSLIPDITCATSVRFSVIYSRLEKFRDEVICTTMLNVKEEDLKQVSAYLNKVGIKWEVAAHE